MSSSHDLKKLQYDGKDIVSEVAVRDDQGRIISSTYVDKITDQTITGCKRFDTAPQILDHYEITTRNLFRKNFNIFDNTGGTGTIYAYFKLPDDGKDYTLSVRLKDSTKSFGTNNVFGWTTNGGTSGGSLAWLVNGDTILSQSHVFYANDAARCISLYYGTEDTFNKLLARYYIQLEEGTTMTEYVDPDSGVENIYVNAAKVNDIPTNVSQLTNDLGYITSNYHDNTKANQSSLNEVTAKIPSAADSNNQLADKAFVNSSIETATATFKGTYTTIAAIEALTADDNDYAFYQHVDSDGNTLFDRYKYNGTQWLYEYTLNNSSFTAAQWAAINSGVSADAWVDTSSAQVIDGQKDFNTVPTVRVESHKGAHNLPSEYQELQYISSPAGSGVISTTLAVDTATYYAVIRASLITFTGGYGTIMGNNSAPQMAFNRTQWYVGNAGGNGQATPPAFNGTIYTLRYSYNGIGDYYVDGNDTGLRRTGSLGLTFFSNSSTGAGNNAAASIYIAEIYRRSDNELIYQFIPARSNSSNQLGFYETVNNIFYPGVGITAGPEDQSGEVIIQYLPVLTGGDFASVAFTGNYNDLIGTPTIPIVNNGTLTIQKNGTTIATFGANQSTSSTANITVPTAISDLTNDSDFITSSDLPTNHVTTDTDQSISGNKTLLNKAIKFADAAGNGMSIVADSSSRLKITNNNNATVLYLQTNGLFSPNNMTLGTANNKFNNLYLGGSLINGTYSITIPNIASKADLASYVDLANEQTVTGQKYFNNRPKVASSPIGTGKNLFATRWSYGQWTSTGGSGSSYIYFKLPDDTKTYTLSIYTKDAALNFGSGNVFGITGNGGSPSAGYQWLVNGNQLSTSVRVITPSDMRYISLYTASEATFEALIAKYNIQLEEGDIATAYEPWVDPEAEAIYYDVALKPEIPTKTSELINDSGFITNTTAHITESQVVNLTNDLTNIREVAEGKSKAIPISIDLNSTFDSQQDTVAASSITDLSGNVIQSSDLKVGDAVYVAELDVPDRWYSGNQLFSKLETQKVTLPTFTPAFNEGTELLSISDGTKVYIPNAGKFSWTDGMVGVVNKSISQLEPGQYSATTTYQSSVVPKATKMSGGEFWNSSSGTPMDISFYFNTPVAPSMVIVGIGTGYGIPGCAIYYYNDNDEETFLQNVTLAAGEAVSAKINSSNIYSNKWIIRLTPDSWVSVKCVDFAAYQIGIVGPDIVNDIMDKASVTWVQQQQYLQYITCNNTRATKTGSTIKIEDVFQLVSGYGNTKQYLTNKNGTFVWEEPVSITKTSDLVNDSGFITSAALDNYTTLNTDQTIEGKKTFTNIPEVALTRTIVPEGSSLPEEYQEVEYLQSTGTQYIDLQYFPVSSDTITIKLAPQESSGDKAFFGCYGGGFTCELGQMGSYYRGNVGSTAASATFAVDDTHELVMYNGVWHKDNVAFGAVNSGTSSISAHVFCRNYNGPSKLSKIKLYSLQVRRNDELYRNFVPCYRTADNVPGLYETVTGAFLTSPTNNNFILGADVDREDQSYDVTETFTLPILERIQGYDITKKQTLKNVYGTFMWVND